jgi:hypothetical protein
MIHLGQIKLLTIMLVEQVVTSMKTRHRCKILIGKLHGKRRIRWRAKKRTIGKRYGGS